MQKNLRSLIHEKIPLELRFQLELLSRKRNLINEEKHEKIIELFREFNIKDIVQLGPGTNRYAIKLDGYVVKIATDNDGKIDNLKEFKMAKRLYPYVTKTYEVSENGTLLVAEYISPFSSYHEMTMYSEQIREILTKLSSTYLIGDVGITSKNYANWGLRAGSKDPVCLDFAYVYEVSSDLFICRKCNMNSMLVPDRDFNKLNCSNPSCGKEYTFEDIRARLGNDIHRHEIGDLKEEGYYLTASNTRIELNDQRSNYLVNKKLKNNKKEKLKLEEDTTMNKNLENNMIIASELATNFNIPIKVISVSSDKNNAPKNVIVAKARLAEPEDDDLAFSGFINDEEDDDMNDLDIDVIQVPNAPNKAIVAKARLANDSDKDINVKNTIDIVSDKSEINDWFIKNMKKAVSNISNRISNCLHIADSYNSINSYLNDKMYAESYYKEVQNAVFNSLVRFCNFDIKTKTNDRGNTYKVFTPPTEIVGTEYEPTLIFISRVWNNKNINTVDDPNMMDVYNEIYSDYLGIQLEWLDLFRQRLSEKLKISKQGIDMICYDIASMWCVPEEEGDDTFEDFEGFEEYEDFEESGDIAFIGNIDMDVVQNPNYEYDEEEEEEEGYEEYEDDEEYTDSEYISVEIYHKDNIDVVCVNTSEFFGRVNIPFYADLNKVDGETYNPSIVDDRNGVWDWLIHMVPDLMFTTKDPDKWLNINNEECDVNQIHIVIMDEDRGVYTMGVYCVNGIYDIDEDGNSRFVSDETILKKINKLIKDDIGYSRISHLVRSLNNTDLICKEEDIVMSIMNNNADVNEIEDAAIDVLMNDESSTESSVEEEVEEEVEEVENFPELFKMYPKEEEDDEDDDEDYEDDEDEDEDDEEVETVEKKVEEEILNITEDEKKPVEVKKSPVVEVVEKEENPGAMIFKPIRRK